MYDRKMIEYLPECLRNVKEYEAILTMAVQPEVEILWNRLDDMLNDQFIQDATENGVSRYEKIMKIVPRADKTLEERKFALITKNNEHPPFTIKWLEKQLEMLCGKGGYSVSRDVGKKILTVRVELAVSGNYNNVEALLERVVPANMEIDLSLMYNKHKEYSTYTHEGLKTLTHNQIRNKVV